MFVSLKAATRKSGAVEERERQRAAHVAAWQARKVKYRVVFRREPRRLRSEPRAIGPFLLSNICKSAKNRDIFIMKRVSVPAAVLLAYVSAIFSFGHVRSEGSQKISVPSLLWKSS